MIRTLQEQDIDAMSRMSGVVYMEARGTRHIDNKVIIDNYFYRIVEEEIIANVEVEVEEEYCSGYNYETGEKTFEIRNVLKNVKARIISRRLEEFRKREAIFKTSTFEDVLGNPKVSQYDLKLIEQIDWVNSKTWTGQEIQKFIYFWNLRSSDLEVVTNEMLEEVLAPTIIEIL